MGRTFAIAALIALSPVLAATAGCGFTPLYAEGAIAPQMNRIDVSVPDGRTAFLLQEQLNDAFGHDQTQPAAYGLDVAVSEHRDPLGLGPQNAASRYELNVQVSYTLTRRADGETLKSGAQQVRISYEAVDQPYAGVAAQKDSQERAAAELARRIRLDIAEYFLNSKR